MDRVRALVLDLWQKTRIDWGFASDRIATAFRREKHLSSRERREVAETLFGMIRQHRRLEFALEGARAPKLTAKPSRGGPGPALPGRGGGEGSQPPRKKKKDVARYLAYRLLAGEITVEDAARELPEVAWSEVARVEERIAREPRERRLALTRSLPDWLAQRLSAEYGGEADGLAAALNQRAPLTLRVNTLRATRQGLIDRLAAEGVTARPTRWAANGVVLDTHVNVYALPAFREGWFEAQDEASQLVAELASPPPKGIVVDACAGAGGKTLALGAAMANRGRLVSLDIDPRKLLELRRRARRAGLTNVHPIEVGASEWPDEVQQYRGRADRVLVDAPCSGMGALRRNPEARWRLAPEDLERLPRQQLEIARRAKELVAPGGWLIYATCTLLKSENEGVAARLADASFTPLPVAELVSDRSLTDESGRYLKMRPDRHDCDGFFAAVFARSGGGNEHRTV